MLIDPCFFPPTHSFQDSTHFTLEVVRNVRSSADLVPRPQPTDFAIKLSLPPVFDNLAFVASAIVRPPLCELVLRECRNEPGDSLKGNHQLDGLFVSGILIPCLSKTSTFCQVKDALTTSCSQKYGLPQKNRSPHPGSAGS